MLACMVVAIATYVIPCRNPGRGKQAGRSPSIESQGDQIRHVWTGRQFESQDGKDEFRQIAPAASELRFGV
jgi:hypothetical protein